MGAAVRIEVSPAEALFDEPVAIRILDAPPGAAVAITASTIDGLGVRWESTAGFVADSQGLVDVARQAPTGGDYRTADPMGLIWSMKRMASDGPPARFLASPLTPPVIAFSARAGDQAGAGARIARPMMLGGVNRTTLRERGLVGTLFSHADGPRPGVLVLGGSGGGLDENMAALLASRGWATLALAYFGYEGLPPEMNRIPLEYFETAMDWMRTQDAVGPGKIAVMGVSRGGELALQLASTFTELSPVVALVPSSVRWRGVGAGLDRTTFPAWTWKGEALPFLVSGEVDPTPPVALAPGFLAAMGDEAAVERASIPVERIDGPILMISGDDDRMWPSAAFAERVVERLRRRGFKHPHTHVSYKDAGHAAPRPPYFPAAVNPGFHPILKVDVTMGGTPEADAAANVASWRAILDFLQEHHA